MRGCILLLFLHFICQNTRLCTSNRGPGKDESNKGENINWRSGKGEPSKAGPSKQDPGKGESSDEGSEPSKKPNICDILPLEGNI
jgi:hypothetical protein